MALMLIVSSGRKEKCSLWLGRELGWARWSEDHGDRHGDGDSVFRAMICLMGMRVTADYSADEVEV